MNKSKTYVYSLDFLRGLLAFQIMLYHFLSWKKLINFDASYYLSIIAIYGVSIFFIISGFALAIQYQKFFKIITFTKLSSFFGKRIARIYPLFWFVIILSIIIGYKHVNDIQTLFIQLSISFSLFENYSGLTPASWSIGIEILLYTLFPFIVFFSNIHKSVSYFVLPLIVLILMYLSAFQFDNNLTEQYFIASYFKPYANNLINHLYFFIVGIILARIFNDYSTHIQSINTGFLLLLIVLMIFLFYPSSGNIGYLVSNEHRIWLSCISILLFLSFLLINEYHFFKSSFSKFIGNISYTIYLTHPVSFYIWFKYMPIQINDIFSIFLVLIFSVINATIVYNIFEIPMKNYLLRKSYHVQK